MHSDLRSSVGSVRRVGEIQQGSPADRQKPPSVQTLLGKSRAERDVGLHRLVVAVKADVVFGEGVGVAAAVGLGEIPAEGGVDGVPEGHAGDAAAG